MKNFTCAALGQHAWNPFGQCANVQLGDAWKQEIIDVRQKFLENVRILISSKLRVDGIVQCDREWKVIKF